MSCDVLDILASTFRNVRMGTGDDEMSRPSVQLVLKAAKAQHFVFI